MTNTNDARRAHDSRGGGSAPQRTNTTRAVEWLCDGVKTDSYPFWSRVLLCTTRARPSGSVASCVNCGPMMTCTVGL